MPLTSAIGSGRGRLSPRLVFAPRSAWGRLLGGGQFGFGSAPTSACPSVGLGVGSAWGGRSAWGRVSFHLAPLSACPWVVVSLGSVSGRAGRSPLTSRNCPRLGSAQTISTPSLPSHFMWEIGGAESPHALQNFSSALPPSALGLAQPSAWLCPWVGSALGGGWLHFGFEVFEGLHQGSSHALQEMPFLFPSAQLGLGGSCPSLLG